MNANLLAQLLGSYLDTLAHPLLKRFVDVEVPDPQPNEFYTQYDGRTYRVLVTDVTED